jgi:hypothetical protein
MPRGKASADDDELVVVVCVGAGEKTHFTDNEFGVCAECGEAVQHRPHIPRPNRLICRECFGDELNARGQGGKPVEVMVSRETVVEVLTFRRRQLH